MAKKVDHKSRAHALLSASASHRWIACPPSARLTEDMPDTTSPFAAEGTKAHETAEKLIRAYLSGKKLDKAIKALKYEKGSDEERILIEVLPYVERLIEDYEKLKKQHPDAVLLIETRVDFSQWVPDGFGTSDAIIIAGNEIHVRDLKFGKGVRVEAENNPQARLYGLGALVITEDLYDIDTVVNEIDQPRLDHFSTETISVTDLYQWADGVLKPAADLAYKGEGDFNAGEHCRFCKAGATCRHRAAHMQNLQHRYVRDLHLLTDTEIGELLSEADEFNAWVNALKEEVLNGVLNEGRDFPGWKVVEGRSYRKYGDPDKVVARLKEKGYSDDLIYSKNLYSITDMTKILGGKKALDSILGDLIVKPAGKPTLVPDTDKRKPLGDAALQSAFGTPLPNDE